MARSGSEVLEGGMDHSVALDRLPADLRFPPEFEGTIRFDAERRVLSYRGFMSKTEYDTLFQLSKDWPYRRALEELFRRTAEDQAPRRGLLRRLAAVAGLA